MNKIIILMFLAISACGTDYSTTALQTDDETQDNNDYNHKIEVSDMNCIDDPYTMGVIKTCFTKDEQAYKCIMIQDEENEEITNND